MKVIWFVSFTRLSFFNQFQFSLTFPVQKVDFFSQAFYIPVNLTFPPWFIFLPMFFSFYAYPYFHPDTCSPNQIIRFCFAPVFQKLDRFVESVCLNLQKKFFHLLKHNAIACNFFTHYFFLTFINHSIFFTRISLCFTNTVSDH